MQIENVPLLSPLKPASVAEAVGPHPLRSRFGPPTVLEVSEAALRALDVSHLDDFEESVMAKVRAARPPEIRAYEAVSEN